MSVGRLLGWSIAIGTLFTLLMSLSAYYLVLDEKPMVLPSPSLVGADIVGLQRMFSKQRAQLAADGRITVSLDQDHIDTAISYALQTSSPAQLEGLRVTLHPASATVASCITLDPKLPRHYINIRAEIAPHGLEPDLQRLQLGLITLPKALVRWLERKALRLLYSNQQQVPGLQTALAALDNIEIRDAQLNVTYRDQPEQSAASWQAPPSLGELPAGLVNAYIATLKSLTSTVNSRRYPMVGLLSPLFEQAALRSVEDTTNAATENAAAIVALSLYAGEPKLLQMAGLTGQFDELGRTLSLTIHRREDLAKHFINSALIYLLAGNQIAELVGLQKELDDADHGSGFSLADLVADKAGIRFAELATAGDISADRLQRDAANLLYDDQIMPHPSTLPPVYNAAQRERMNESDTNRYLHELDRAVQPLLAPIELYHYKPQHPSQRY